MKGPTKAPFGKAFALAAIGLAAGVAVLFAAFGTPSNPEAAGRVVGQVFFLTWVPAAVVGWIARRSPRVWSFGRIGGLWLAGVAALAVVNLAQATRSGLSIPAGPVHLAEPSVPTAPAPTSTPVAVAPVKPEPLPDRQALFKQMREGYAQRAPGVPNLLDLIAERFPADADNMMRDIMASPLGSPEEAERRGTMAAAKTFVAIQARDGEKLSHASGAAVRQLMAAQRDVLIAAADAGLPCTQIARAPSQALARLSIIRLYSLLSAIADGRDHPVERAAASKEDYAAFGRAAVASGVDVAQWKGVSDPELAAKEPARVCQALISMYEAALKTDGPLGERILAALAEDQLTTSMAVYQPVLK